MFRNSRFLCCALLFGFFDTMIARASLPADALMPENVPESILYGEWLVESIYLDNSEVRNPFVKVWRYNRTGYTVGDDFETVMSFKYSINLETTPNEMVITPVAEHEDYPKVIRAIFKVEGNTLLMSWHSDGKEFPRDFERPKVLRADQDKRKFVKRMRRSNRDN